MLFKLFQKNKIPIKYSDLSSAEQKKILKKSIREANDEQRQLVEEFNKKFKHAN